MAKKKRSKTRGHLRRYLMRHDRSRWSLFENKLVKLEDLVGRAAWRAATEAWNRERKEAARGV